MLILLAALAAGGCIFLLIWGFYSLHEEVLRGAENGLNEEPIAEARPLPIRVLLPYARVIAQLLSRISLAGTEGHVAPYFVAIRHRLADKLTSAGNPAELSAEEFVGLIVVSGVAAGIASILPFYLLPWNGIIVIMVVIGFALPIIWLNDRAKARQLAIRKGMPFALDLLTLSVEAGLDFTSAVSVIAEKIRKGPLAVEFARMLQQIRMGKGRSDALRDLGHRCNVSEMTSFTNAMVQAEELGATIGPILRVQAQQLRTSRSQRAEKLAMEAPVKMIFPLVAFIFPTVFVIIFASLYIYFLAAG